MNVTAFRLGVAGRRIVELAGGMPTAAYALQADTRRDSGGEAIVERILAVIDTRAERRRFGGSLSLPERMERMKTWHLRPV